MLQWSFLHRVSLHRLYAGNLSLNIVSIWNYGRRVRVGYSTTVIVRGWPWNAQKCTPMSSLAFNSPQARERWHSGLLPKEFLFQLAPLSDSFHTSGKSQCLLTQPLILQLLHVQWLPGMHLPQSALLQIRDCFLRWAYHLLLKWHTGLWSPSSYNWLNIPSIKVEFSSSYFKLFFMRKGGCIIITILSPKVFYSSKIFHIYKLICPYTISNYIQCGN